MKPLAVPGILDSLGDIAEYIKAAAAAADLDSKAAYRLRLAVDEIVTNIVTHGYAETGLTGAVDLRAEIDRDTLTIIVEDTAVAYDPRQRATPDDLDLPLAQREMGGLGLHLVLQNVDQFLYARVGDRNRNTLIMNRPGKEHQAMDTKPKRLLIVDQDVEDRLSMSNHFTQLGWQVTTAESGRQALDIVGSTGAGRGRAQRFDLVLLDISRLGEDNYRALEQLRTEPALESIPVIVVATADGIGETLQCLDAGAQAAIVLKEKTSKMERDLEIGHQVQIDFLPKRVLQPPGWEIATHFDPARDVAGDFYDVIALPRGKVGLVVADVCDKGVGPALFMSLSRSLMRAFSEANRISHWMDELSVDMSIAFNVTDEQQEMLSASGSSALLAVELTNDYIALNHPEMFMFLTIFFGVLDPDTGVLTYVNGGHETAFIVGPTGGIKARLPVTGPAVGLDAEAQFGYRQAMLEPGDLLLAYSDGVPDARDPGRERFTHQRLLPLLEQPAPSAAALLERIRANVWAHIGNADQYDDITMLAARRVVLAS